MKQVRATLNDSDLVVEIPAEYLENAFELGITTNSTGSVTDREEMLNHFKRKFLDSDNGSHFGRFVDAVCAEAIEDGESFVDADEEWED